MKSEWRYLEVGERVRNDDEVLFKSGTWHPVGPAGFVHQKRHNAKRRLIKTPETIADLWGLIDERLRRAGI